MRDSIVMPMVWMGKLRHRMSKKAGMSEVTKEPFQHLHILEFFHNKMLEENLL